MLLDLELLRPMTDFESWLAMFMFRHPLLASDTNVLPGLRVRDMVVTIARAAWDAATPLAETSMISTPVLAALSAAPEVEALATRRADPDKRRRLSEAAKRRWERMTPDERRERTERMQAGRRRPTIDQVAEALSA